MAKHYCNRCTYDMWYDETKKRWYCSNPKCVKYKPQPKPEPEPTGGNTAPEPSNKETK